MSVLRNITKTTSTTEEQKRIARIANEYYDTYSERYDRAALLDVLDPKLTVLAFRRVFQTNPMLAKFTAIQAADQIIKNQMGRAEHARMVGDITKFLALPGFVEQAQIYAANYVPFRDTYPSKEAMIEAANDLAAAANIIDKFHTNADYREAMMLLVQQYFGKAGNKMIHILYSPNDGERPSLLGKA